MLTGIPPRTLPGRRRLHLAWRTATRRKPVRLPVRRGQGRTYISRRHVHDLRRTSGRKAHKGTNYHPTRTTGTCAATHQRALANLSASFGSLLIRSLYQVYISLNAGAGRSVCETGRLAGARKGRHPTQHEIAAKPFDWRVLRA